MDKYTLMLTVGLLGLYLLYRYLTFSKEKFVVISKYFFLFTMYPIYLFYFLSLDFYLATKDFSFESYIFVMISFILMIMGHYPFKIKYLKELENDIKSLINGLFLVNIFIFPITFNYMGFHTELSKQTDSTFFVYVILSMLSLLLFYHKDIINIVRYNLFKNRKHIKFRKK